MMRNPECIHDATCVLAAALVASLHAARRHAQQASAELHVMPMRGNVFMIVGGGSNVTVSAGVDGMFLVDTGSAAMADKMLEKVMEIGRMVAGSPAPMTTCVGPPLLPGGKSWTVPALRLGGASYNAVIASPKALKPIRWIIQTTADTDHNGGTTRSPPPARPTTAERRAPRRRADSGHGHRPRERAQADDPGEYPGGGVADRDRTTSPRTR